MTSSVSSSIQVKISWNDLAAIEAKLLETLRSVGIRNIAEADVVLSKQNGEVNVRIELKPFAFPDTERDKGVTANTVPLLGEHRLVCIGTEFRQEKTNKRRRLLVSTGTQTTSRKL